MEQASEYIGLLATFLISVTIAAAIIVLNHLLGPKHKPSAAKLEPFECGKERFETRAGRFSVQFYLVGMLFILFDVEIVWFFPWAVILREIGWFGLFEMFAFIGVLVLGYVYARKKGALEWQR